MEVYILISWYRYIPINHHHNQSTENTYHSQKFPQPLWNTIPSQPQATTGLPFVIETYGWEDFAEPEHQSPRTWTRRSSRHSAVSMGQTRRGVEVTGARLPSAHGKGDGYKAGLWGQISHPRHRFQSTWQVQMRFGQLLGLRQSAVCYRLKETLRGWNAQPK